MKKGISRFDCYLNKLQPLLLKAEKQKNPALWLYQNNTRTILFMLEGLSKLYSGLHNKKLFEKLKQQFKLLEDTLGAIDYYDAFLTEFSQNKKITDGIKNYLLAQKREKTERLNDILADKKWIGAENERMIKIRKKLLSADWLKEKEEIEAIYTFYGRSIYEIKATQEKKQFNFTNIETDVHELRRKLRWLSIYPQALGGCIQLVQKTPTPKHLDKYLTKEIINSPFNKLPPNKDCRFVLMFNQPYFLSLSWMIDALGRQKDEGLRVILIHEALRANQTIDKKNIFSDIYNILGPKQTTLPVLLENAEKITQLFFQENNLEYLVSGIKKINPTL